MYFVTFLDIEKNVGWAAIFFKVWFLNIYPKDSLWEV